MDGLVLPVLAEEDPVDEALQRMSQLGSRAMMVRKPEDYVLYTNRAVVAAWAAEEPTCARLVAYGASRRRCWSCGGSGRPRAPSRRSSNSSSTGWGAQLGVLVQPRPEDRTMFVVTRHEEKRDEIADAGEECACHGPMRHTASNPPATGGSPCPVCGFTYSCW